MSTTNPLLDRVAGETPRDDRVPRHLSISNEHATPVEVIEAARALLGGIDLDSASCALAQSRVKATDWFGLDHPIPGHHDALDQNWASGLHPTRVWLNPPGGKINGQSSAKVFWFKLALEYLLGHVHSAAFLGFSVEILQTTQVKTPKHGDLGLSIPLDFPICIPSRRLKFDKMVPRCTLCGRFIDPDRAKLVKGKDPSLCSPDVELTADAFNRVIRSGSVPVVLDWDYAKSQEKAISFFGDDPVEEISEEWFRTHDHEPPKCPRNGIEHWGPLDFAPGDSPPHSNVLVYLPPRDMDTADAKRKFQDAFRAIGRVR